MADFSVITQSPAVRALVQDNLLERAFKDALFPRLLYRGEATPVPWAANVGDTQYFTATGLMPVSCAPLAPGQDPIPQTYPVEQWQAQLLQYAGTIDTHMPTSMVAIANLFLRNAHTLGLQAAMTINRIVRNRMYNAALSGWTVADGAQAAVTTLRVKRLNGLTRARRPDLAAGSPVRYELVSSTNPLGVTIYDNTGPAAVTRTITGFTPDTAGDETGPGTITLTGGAVTVSDRAYVYTDDRTYIVRSGGGNKVDDIGASDVPTLADIRDVVSHFQEQTVPEHPDDRFHCHLSPVSVSKLFNDTEFQRLLTALPEDFRYKQFALGELLGVVFFRNSESPIPTTVGGGTTATFSQNDPFAGELYNTGVSSGLKIQRMLFTAQGGVFEYYADLSNLLTEAGIIGKVGEPQVTNNGIDVMTDRIQLMLRAPLNRLQDKVSASWKFIGDWPVRTDGCVGDASRYKRFACIEHS